MTQEITAEPGSDACAPNSHTVSQPESVKWDAADSESAAWCSAHSCYTSSAAQVFSSDLELCPEKLISQPPCLPRMVLEIKGQSLSAARVGGLP